MNKKKKITLAVAVLLVFCLAIGGTLAYLATVSNQVQNTFTFGNIRLTLDEKDLTEGAAADARTNTGNAYNLALGGTYDKDPTVTVRKGSEECYVRMLVKVDLKVFGTAQLKEFLQTYAAQNQEKAAAVLAALAQDGWLVAVPGTTPPQYRINTTKLIQVCLVNSWNETPWPRTGIWYGKAAGSEAANDMVGIAEYTYNATVNAMTEEKKLEPLFTKFYVPNNDNFTNLVTAGYDPLTLIYEFLDYINAQGQTDYTITDLLPSITIIAQAVSKDGYTSPADAFAAAGVPAGFEHIADPLTNPTFP